MKIAFFDMDGTIAAPRYIDKGKPVIGFDAQGWIDYCNKTQPDAYAICKVIQPSRRLRQKTQRERISPLYPHNVVIKGRRNFQKKFRSTDETGYHIQ